MIILLIMVVCLIKHCFNNGKVVVNHIFCFSVGYLYYVILPLFIFELQLDMDDVLYKSELAYYNAAPEENKIYYLLVSFLWMIAFFLGNKCCRYVFGKSRIIFQKQPSKVNFNLTQNLFFIPVMILGCIILYRCREDIFVGYTTTYNVASRGLLSAFVILLFSLILLYAFSNNMMKWSTIFSNKWGIAYIIFALLLLSTGGRLYVVSNIVALIISFTYLKSDGIKVRKMFLMCIIGSIFVGLMGVIRFTVTSKITILDIFFNIIQETIYTNYSLVTYLNSRTFCNILSFPKVLLSSFINLIPSVLFEDKSNYIMSILDFEPTVFSPLGAMHYFVSYNSDLGIILSFFFFFVLGHFLGYLAMNKEKNALITNVVYALVSSHLMFTLFRDPVSVALVKNVVEFSILIPFIVILINNQIGKIK